MDTTSLSTSSYQVYQTAVATIEAKLPGVHVPSVLFLFTCGEWINFQIQLAAFLAARSRYIANPGPYQHALELLVTCALTNKAAWQVVHQHDLNSICLGGGWRCNTDTLEHLKRLEPNLALADYKLYSLAPYEVSEAFLQAFRVKAMGTEIVEVLTTSEYLRMRERFEAYSAIALQENMLMCSVTDESIQDKLLDVATVKRFMVVAEAREAYLKAVKDVFNFRATEVLGISTEKDLQALHQWCTKPVA